MAHDEVATAARGGELDRYLAALLAPETMRADLLAIAAFAAEMRRIPGLVREPMMGEIRLQWWRDTIDSFGAAESQPNGAIADALGQAARRHSLARPMLQAMTEARAFDLYDDPMPDEASFRGYLDKTEATPFALALKVCGAEDVPAALADHAGRAYGTARLLTELPAWLSKGRMPLPLSYLAEAGCDVDDFRQGTVTAGLGRLFDRLIGDIESDARAATTMARRHLARGHRLAVLPIATIPTYLRTFHAARHGPLQSMLEVSGLRRITRIARAHWLGL